MDLFDLLQGHVAVFLLMLTRISGLFMVSPFFGSLNIPVTFRAGIALACSVALFPMVDAMGPVKAPPTILAYTATVLGELLIGWLIGLVAFTSFAAINMAGKLMDMQVGFSIANVMDPTSGQQMPLIGSFLYNLTLIVFVVANGHHMLLAAIVGSFQAIPLMGLSIGTTMTELFTRYTVGIFLMGVQIALPVTFGLLLTNVGLGILARTMPQLNIFVVGVPLHILVGLFILMIVVPFYVLFLDVLFNEMYGDISLAIQAMH